MVVVDVVVDVEVVVDVVVAVVVVDDIDVVEDICWVDVSGGVCSEGEQKPHVLSHLPFKIAGFEQSNLRLEHWTLSRQIWGPIGIISSHDWHVDLHVCR